MEKIGQKKFEEVKNKAENFYKTVGSVFCPYFEGKVNFNARGLDHIKFKKWNMTRLTGDQYVRLLLIRFAPEILKKSHTVQGVWETKSFERIKISKRWDTILKEVSFYEFVAVLEKTRIKIIVKQIEGGERCFWSIIPFWGIDKNSGKKKLHSGEPQSD